MRLVSALLFAETLSPYSRSFLSPRWRHRIAPHCVVQYADIAVWLDTEGAGLENWPSLVFLSLKANVRLVLPLPPPPPTIFLLSYRLLSGVVFCINEDVVK